MYRALETQNCSLIRTAEGPPSFHGSVTIAHGVWCGLLGGFYRTEKGNIGDGRVCLQDGSSAV